MEEAFWASQAEEVGCDDVGVADSIWRHQLVAKRNPNL